MRAFILATIFGFGSLISSSCTAYYPEEYDAPNDDERAYEQAGSGPEIGMFADLSVYGEWHHASSYGWVWSPYVAVGWQPFYYGHWVWTDYGWMWVSYEPFGWATCHYGSWIDDYQLGWVWVPGYDWSPACVEWVVYDDYVCWAPRPPRGVHIGDPWAPTRVSVWTVVSADHFTDTNVGRHRVSPSKFKSRYANREAAYRAPDRRYVERYEGRTIRSTPVEVQRSRKDGREVRRVVLPPEQKRVVEKNRVHTQSRPTRAKESGTQETQKQKKEKSKKSKSRGHGKQGKGGSEGR